MKKWVYVDIKRAGRRQYLGKVFATVDDTIEAVKAAGRSLWIVESENERQATIVVY